MSADPVGERIVDVRIARGRKGRPEALERFTEAMNALLPERERVHWTTVGRWEDGAGRPNVVQGWAITQLDPQHRPMEWLAVGNEQPPATRESAGGEPNLPIAETGPLTEANRPGIKRVPKRRGTA